MNLEAIQIKIISFWQRFGEDHTIVATISLKHWHDCLNSFSAYLFDAVRTAIDEHVFYYMGVKVIYSQGLQYGEIIIGVK